MTKATIIFRLAGCFMLLFILGAAAAPAVSAAALPLAIDTERVYTGMESSYAEGYLPAVSGGQVTIVLPLLPETAAGPLTASVHLGDPANSPFIHKNYERQFNRKHFTFGDETVECYLVQFDLELSADRLNGSYPVTITVRGRSGEGEAFSQQFTIYVRISDGRDAKAPEPAPPPAPSIRPRLMVAGYKLDRDYLEAGESATVTVTVRNTSSSQKVHNIKLSFNAEGGEILPAGTGAAYCDKIGQGGSYTWSFTVNVTATAQSRPHPATITMEYEDGSGNVLTAADRIILPVRQPVRLAYEEPSLPARVTEGDTVPLTVMLMNLGKSAVYNVLLKFEMPGLAAGGSVLVGTIPPGEFKTGTASFRAGSGTTGTVSGTLLLSYEDEYGEYYAEEIPLSTTIEKKIDPAVPAETGPPPGLPRGIVYAAAGAVLLAVACFFTFRWHKEKKAREEDEMRL